MAQKNRIMKREIIILIMLAVNGIFFARSSSKTTGIDKLYSAFMKEYETLNIPDTDLDYTVNFSRIQSVTELEKQEKFFQKYKNDLSRIDFLILNAEQKIKHKHLAYQVARNLERISLEKNWNGNKITSPKGLFGLPHGKKMVRISQEQIAQHIRSPTSSQVMQEIIP